MWFNIVIISRLLFRFHFFYCFIFLLYASHNGYMVRHITRTYQNTPMWNQLMSTFIKSLTLCICASMSTYTMSKMQTLAWMQTLSFYHPLELSYLGVKGPPTSSSPQDSQLWTMFETCELASRCTDQASSHSTQANDPWRAYFPKAQ